MSFEFFAPCPRGLEAALAAELAETAERRLPPGALEVGAEVPGGVHFRGNWAGGMAANLHSRIASRVLLKIAQRPYRSEQDIYALAREQRWDQWFTPNETLRVDITAIKSPLRSLEFATLRVKDAICDRMRDKAGARPSIDTAYPDVRVFAFLTANECTLYLDTSGEPLFKRGWRLDKGAAPLRENLAAGILRLTGWSAGTPLYDPMCGSGTFLAEAAQVALDIAPGLDRRFGFESLKQADMAAWRHLKSEANTARNAAQSKPHELLIFGSDISDVMLEKARANFKRGWRLDKGAAPLRENLAAGILRLTGWSAGTPLYDPMCGSGTFLAEAAQVALDIAPGLDRRFGFESLKQADMAAWRHLKSEANTARNLAQSKTSDLLIYGSDISDVMLEKARANFKRAGFGSVTLKQLDARNMTPPSATPGILVANPPYGERIEVRGRNARGEARPTARELRGDDDDEGFRRARDEAPDAEFFQALGDALKQRFTGWRAFVLTSDRKLPGQLRLREAAKTPLFNGALECRLFRFDLIAGSVRQRPASGGANPAAGNDDAS